MQFTITTDYAIRTVAFLAKAECMQSASVIASNLTIPGSYVPKVIRLLKQAGIVDAVDGARGGCYLTRKPSEIMLYDIVKATESTLYLNRCLEPDADCSRVTSENCSICRVFHALQERFESSMREITVADLIGEGSPDYFGAYLTQILVDLKTRQYRIIYVHDGVFQSAFEPEGAFTDQIVERALNLLVVEEDRAYVRDLLREENLFRTDLDVRWERNIRYRRPVPDGVVWMEMSLYYDKGENTLLISSHNPRMVQLEMGAVERELSQVQKRNLREFWDVVSVLAAVLDYDPFEGGEHLKHMVHYTALIYNQLAAQYPELQITAGEIENVSRLSVLHDIGKAQIPTELLNKREPLTEEEAQIVRRHTILGGELTLRLPHKPEVQGLNEYSYNICRFHHERYDGGGYPDGLKGDEIPRCAQVVGLANAYDHLVKGRPNERGRTPQEALEMIVSGQCGAFSPRLISSFIKATEQKDWLMV